MTMEIPRGRPILNGKVDGWPVEFELDTGADVVTLSADTGRALFGGNLKYLHSMLGVGGGTRVADVTVDVDVDGIVVSHVRASVLPPDVPQVNLLGLSFLNRIGRFEFSGGHLKRVGS